MKRIISLLMCIVLVCSMLTVTVNATENYFATFHSEIQKLWFAVVFGGGENNIYEFTPRQIKWVTDYKIDRNQYNSYDKLIEYSYGDTTYSYTLRYYAIPADVYEAQALKLFNISDISILRNDVDNDPKYNAETHTYDMPDAGGMGDSIAYATKGYKAIGDGKYEVYGYTVEQAYEVPEGAILGIDYIIMPYGNAAEIVKCLRVTIEYNGADVKFLSWETIALEEIPADDDLVFACEHTASEWIVDKNSTCTETGLKHQECIDCGEILNTTIISVADHTATDWVIDKNPTCFSEGSHFKYCKECGITLETEKIAKKSHKAGSWETTKKATVDTAGTKVKKCTVCKEIVEKAKIAQLKCSKPKLSKIENTADGVKITWGKVSGADKYYVYRKTSGGSYSKIGTATKTYYTDKKAKSGKKYYYYVKAVNEAGSSEASSSKSILHLSDPILKTPKSIKKGITLNWSKVKGAEGYVIYYKIGSGSYKKLTTVKGSSKVAYTHTKAKKGKTYTYKVKAYKSKTYSAYSNAKKIKDKY